MKILTIAGSTSKVSINKQLAVWASGLFSGAEIKVLNLNDFEMPLFSVDIEAEIGPQENAKKFIDEIGRADLLVISLAEHNGTYTVAFKNILDWSSRQNGKLFQNKPILLMATSPGARGGMSVLESAKGRFPFLGAEIKAVFSLPEFEKNFVAGKGIVNTDLRTQLEKIVQTLST